MAKAAPEEQLRLLEVAALDSETTRLSREVTEATADARLVAAQTALDDARSVHSEVQERVETAASALNESEQAVEKVAAHIAKDQARINANAGTASDMMALSHEIDSLTVRRNDLEDTQLELMGTLEEVQEEAAIAGKLIEARAAEHAEHLARRDTVVGTLQAKLAETKIARAELATTFDESLMGTYDRLRTRTGIGAARLFHGKSEASGIALSAGDLAELRASKPDELVFCPDTGAILVRSSEWGA